MTAAVSTLQPDLADPDTYAAGLPHAAFSRLRREQPVSWAHDGDGRGFWSVTSFRLVDEVSRNSDVFSLERKHGGFRLYDEGERHLRLPASVLSAAPSEHTHLRGLLATAFSAPRLAALKLKVRALAGELLDQAVGGPGGEATADLATAFAGPLTMGAFLALVGARAEDAPMVRRWSNALVGDQDPDFACDWEALAKEVAAFAFNLWNERSASPREDLISTFASPEAQAVGVTFFDFLATLMVLIVAGNETTRNSILGGARALIEHRDQFELVAADRSLIRPMVQETVRWTSPLIHMRRTALERVELGGRTIEPGQRVAIWFASSNFDETMFADPLRFDARRFQGADAPPQLAFGAGVHRCIGRLIAELQIQIAFEELLDRVGGMRFAARPQRIRSNFINGYKSMPIAFETL